MLRSSPILEYASTTLITITFVGAITAFFASSTGLLQNDLKRVIAYSTCSQMGYLFIACGLSQYNAALFHLVNHAFFKALLFLSAGAVLHATLDQQDQRKLGGLLGFLPFSYTSILVGSLSLMALPFLTGFYSKDLILELSYGQYLFQGQMAYYLGTISASLTAFYSLRLISLTFLTYPNANKNVYAQAHEANTIVMVVLTVLSLLAIFFGYLARDLYVGVCSDFLSESLFIHPTHINMVEAEFGMSTMMKLLPLFATLLGAGLALYLYNITPLFTSTLAGRKESSVSTMAGGPNKNIKIKGLNLNTISTELYRFFNGKYYVDVIYNYYVIYSSLFLGYTLSKTLDRGLIEMVGPYGLSVSLSKGSEDISTLDTGSLTNYALYIMISVTTLLSLLFSNVLFMGQANMYINLEVILLFFAFIVMLPRPSLTSRLAKINCNF